MADWVERFRRNRLLLGAALAAYVPIIFSSPGRVGADTKTYLYLDPGRLLEDATSLWDSDVALGTVTHQTIGYIWPMGPFYWVLETIGSPDWFAQRLWLGSLLFAAGAGVRYLLKTLDWQGGGMFVAILAYELSPYLLDYSARISAVLLPWAGLPWLLALTIRAARSGGWRYPALFALVALTVGSVNATSLLLVGLAPVLWLFHAALVEKSLRVREAVTAALRIGSISFSVSLWWIAGLILQGGYSLPVTRYTETYEVVADAATAPEVLRGLGYWFFYGNDKFGQWIEPSIEYTQGVWLLFLSYGLVTLALLGAALVRWRHRSYFVLLIVVGALVAIGSHPFDSPSALGSLFKSFTTTDAGLALRSTPRALPMVVLATAVLLGTVINALERRWNGWSRPFTVLVLIAVVLNNPAMWRIRMIEEHLDRDENIPTYWLEAIDALDASERDGRVMELPGSDFASYRWGNTVDPITPGILDRGYVARELVPFGSAESAALLTAFDRRFQEDTADPESVAPIAQLMSVDDIVHRGDLTYERFRTPRPIPTGALLDAAPGLSDGIGFGPLEPNVAGPEQTLLDEVFLGIDTTLPSPAPVTTYEVAGALDIVRTRPTTGSIVIVGDADGIVDAAGAGLLDTARPVWFAADLLADPALAELTLAQPTSIVLTDTNHKRAKRWGTLRENIGYVEQAGEVPLRVDPTDNRLPVFSALEQVEGLDIDDTRTVSVQRGDFSIQATAYGNPVTYTNDDRPVLAVDGDLSTAWVVAAFAEARGERLVFTFDEPTLLSEMTLVQALDPANRSITEVKISADGVVVALERLSDESRGPTGQRVEWAPGGEASTYEIEIVDLDFPERATYPGVSAVGFAEVRLGAEPRPIIESRRLPVAFMTSLGTELENHDLSVILTRERSNPQEPVRDDAEADMRRDVILPTARTFTVHGSVRLSATASESSIDALIGRIQTRDGTGISARSSGRLPGHLPSAASFAFDNDATTAWTGVFGPQRGQWLEITADDSVSFDGITVDIVVDAVHSVPTELRVWVDGENVGEFPTGLSQSDGARGEVASVSLPAVGTGSTVRLEATVVDERITRDWYSNAGTAMPISIAEVRVADGLYFLPPADIDSGCAALAEIDGVPVAIRVVGTSRDALARSELIAEGCSDIRTPIGGFTIQVTSRAVGFDLDRLVLRSPRPVENALAQVAVGVIAHDDTSYDLAVPGADVARWLVLGQSYNTGWQASVAGSSLGEPVHIDGFANGWLLPAGNDLVVELRWTPQRLVERGLVFSFLAVLAAIALAVRGGSDAGARLARRADGGSRPQLRPLPWLDTLDEDPTSGSTRRAWIAALLVAVFAVVNLPQWPTAAIALGGVALLAVRWPRTWFAPSLLGAAIFGVAALSIMIEQRRFRHPPDFVWPQQFDDVHILGVLCLLLLFADYVVSAAAPEREP